jgi:hypothetical protein
MALQRRKMRGRRERFVNQRSSCCCDDFVIVDEVVQNLQSIKEVINLSKKKYSIFKRRVDSSWKVTFRDGT